MPHPGHSTPRAVFDCFCLPFSVDLLFLFTRLGVALPFCKVLSLSDFFFFLASDAANFSSAIRFLFSSSCLYGLSVKMTVFPLFLELPDLRQSFCIFGNGETSNTLTLPLLELGLLEVGKQTIASVDCATASPGVFLAADVQEVTCVPDSGGTLMVANVPTVASVFGPRGKSAPVEVLAAGSGRIVGLSVGNDAA